MAHHSRGTLPGTVRKTWQQRGKEWWLEQDVGWSHCSHTQEAEYKQEVGPGCTSESPPPMTHSSKAVSLGATVAFPQSTSSWRPSELLGDILYNFTSKP